MAQEPGSKTSVETFMQVAVQLIQEAAAYASADQPDEATEANIRQLRTMSAALQAALQMATPPARRIT